MAVAYRSGSTLGYATTNSAVLTKPTGLVVGDLMLVHLSGDISTLTPTAPTGWTQLFASLVGESEESIVYTKIAVQADVDATDFTWSWSTANQRNASIMAFSGSPDIAFIYNQARNTGSTSSTRTFNIPVTPTSDDALLVALCCSSGVGSGSVTSFAVQNNNPSWTELYDQYSGTAILQHSGAYSSAYTEESSTGNLVVVAGGTIESSDYFHGALVVVQKRIVPTVTTQAVTDIEATTATGNGNVTLDGGSTITERGVCWNTSANPTTANSKATASGTTGAFTASMTGLSSGTIYYVRAYATNANGTEYGEEVKFTSDNLSLESPVYVGGKTGTAIDGGQITIDLTDLTGGVGTAAQEGDIVIVGFANAGTSQKTLTLSSSDYNAIASGLYANDSTDTNLFTFYKIMGSTPDTSVVTNSTSSFSESVTCAVQVWRNFDTTTPFDVTPTTATGTDSGRPIPPAITPTTQKSVIICIGAGADDDGAFTFSTTTLSNFITDGANDTYDSGIGMGSFVWTLSDGTYTPAQFGESRSLGTDASWCAVTLVLRASPRQVPVSVTDTLSFSENNSYLRSRISNITDTLGMNDTGTAFKTIIIDVINTLHLTESLLYVTDFVANITDTLGLVDSNIFKYKWDNKTKGSSSWTEKSRTNTSWADKTKSNSSWTGKNKSTSSWVDKVKNSSLWTNKIR